MSAIKSAGMATNGQRPGGDWGGAAGSDGFTGRGRKEEEEQ